MKSYKRTKLDIFDEIIDRLIIIAFILLMIFGLSILVFIYDLFFDTFNL